MSDYPEQREVWIARKPEPKYDERKYQLKCAREALKSLANMNLNTKKEGNMIVSIKYSMAESALMNLINELT